MVGSKGIRQMRFQFRPKYQLLHQIDPKGTRHILEYKCIHSKKHPRCILAMFCPKLEYFQSSLWYQFHFSSCIPIPLRDWNASKTGEILPKKSSKLKSIDKTTTKGVLLETFAAAAFLCQLKSSWYVLLGSTTKTFYLKIGMQTCFILNAWGERARTMLSSFLKDNWQKW